MVKIQIKDHSGETRFIDAQPGISLMENIRDNNFPDLLALCGGCCSCATCHVYVDPEWLDKLEPQETDELELLAMADERRENSRLSCQIKVNSELNGLKVEIAPSD